MRSMPVRIILLSMFITGGLTFAEGQGASPPPPPKKTGSAKDTSKKTGTTNQTVYNPGDVIATRIQGSHLFDGSDVVLAVVQTFLTNQSNGDALLDAAGYARSTLFSKDVVIVHVALWKSSSSGYRPTQGGWAFYRVDNEKHLHQDHDLSGTPYLYNPPHIYFIDLNYFDDAFDGTKATLDYSITTTPRQRQNASDLALGKRRVS